MLCFLENNQSHTKSFIAIDIFTIYLLYLHRSMTISYSFLENEQSVRNREFHPYSSLCILKHIPKGIAKLLLPQLQRYKDLWQPYSPSLLTMASCPWDAPLRPLDRPADSASIYSSACSWDDSCAGRQLDTTDSPLEIGNITCMVY